MKGKSSKLTYKICFKIKMANTLSVMTNSIRNVVSRNRIRYVDDKYNLDLAYIRHNIIAMGYPAENLESIYRNRIDDVVNFFSQNHPDHYRIYNLCSERKYSTSKFNNRVATFSFVDHCPPSIELIEEFCKDVDDFLKLHNDNVVAIHCKAGKGRTGTMISCYLIYSNFKETAEEALAYYDEKRTTDRKGVTIPSQRRYVSYFSKLRVDKLQYTKKFMQICEIRFSSAPVMHHSGSVSCYISTLVDPKCPDKVKEVKCIPMDFSKRLSIELDNKLFNPCILFGDVKIEVKGQKKENSFHFWFNTFFVCDSAEREGEGDNLRYKFVLTKSELDDAHKDRDHKYFAEDFKVTIILKPGDQHSPYLQQNNYHHQQQHPQIQLQHQQQHQTHHYSSTPFLQNEISPQQQTSILRLQPSHQQQQQQHHPHHPQQLHQRHSSQPQNNLISPYGIGVGKGRIYSLPPQQHPQANLKIQQQTIQNHNSHNHSSSSRNSSGLGIGGGGADVFENSLLLEDKTTSTYCNNSSSSSSIQSSAASSASNSSSALAVESGNGEDWESESGHQSEHSEGKEPQSPQPQLVPHTTQLQLKNHKMSPPSSSLSSPPFANENSNRGTLIRKPLNNSGSSGGDGVVDNGGSAPNNDECNNLSSKIDIENLFQYKNGFPLGGGVQTESQQSPSTSVVTSTTCR